jgi:hypothetical protein
MSQPTETCSAVRATPALTAGGYTTGQCLGGVLTFTNLCSERQSALIESVVVYDKAKQNANIDLILFSAMPSVLTGLVDKAVADIAAADLPLVIGTVQLRAANWITLNTAGLAVASSLGLAAACAGRSVYGILVNRGTPTVASVADLSVLLGVLRD